MLEQEIALPEPFARVCDHFAPVSPYRVSENSVAACTSINASLTGFSGIDGEFPSRKHTPRRLFTAARVQQNTVLNQAIATTTPSLGSSTFKKPGFFLKTGFLICQPRITEKDTQYSPTKYNSMVIHRSER